MTNSKSFAGQVWSTLSAIDVSNHVEKKLGLSYLSWAWAWGVMMEHYPETQYSFEDRTLPNGTMEVTVTVVVSEGDKSMVRTMWLPVMNHKNQAVVNPDSFALNTAKMRCLTKCFAMLGLGHYIYAGEDLPQPAQEAASAPISREQADSIHKLLKETESDVVKFCKAFGVNTVDDLKAGQYDQAIRIFDKKKEQKNAGQ